MPRGAERLPAAYAERNDYNRNLWALLKHHEARGRLEVVDVDAEVIGTNPNNSVSRIIWQKRTAVPPAS